MAIYHISMSFAQLPDAELDEFTSGVTAGITGNPAFPTPAVTPAVLTAAQTAFEDAMTAKLQGGQQATALKNQTRLALVKLLRKEANYVQLTADNDLPTMLSSGFLVNSNSRTQSQLATPNIISLDNGMTTQLIVRGQGVDNARSYEAQVKNGTGAWTPAGTFTQARRMVLAGLTPGQIYAVQIRAVGGSTGYSDWSDAVTHMVM